MTRTFKSMEEWMAFCETLPARVVEAAPTGLEAGAALVQHATKAALGTYQSGVGPFPGWAPLDERTTAEREKWGYSGDEPLEVTRALHDNIERTVDRGALAAAVGVPSVFVGDHDSPGGDPHTRIRDIGIVAAKMEFGDPPRSFLGIAAAAHADAVVDIMAAPVVAAVAGQIAPLFTAHGTDDTSL